MGGLASAPSMAAPMAAAPSMAEPVAPVARKRGEWDADDLACIAMKMHMSEAAERKEAGGERSADEIPVMPGLEPGGHRNVWSPLKMNDRTGRVEALLGSDSPIEPGLSKREVSFSTQMVRRAVSFIFDETAGNSPVKQRSTPPAVVA